LPNKLGNLKSTITTIIAIAKPKHHSIKYPNLPKVWSKDRSLNIINDSGIKSKSHDITSKSRPTYT
jgi:hypothetical protein